MTNRSCIASPSFMLLIAFSIAQAQGTQTKDPVPDIAGEWTGTWSTYNPAQGAAPAKEICKSLGCKVVHKDGVWEATFEGDCGRPYKYTIKMEGRQIGRVVMFKGTTDSGLRTEASSTGSAEPPTRSSSGSSRAGITPACSISHERSEG